MAARVTSVFLYVDDVLKSLEFYNEIVGAEVRQVHAEYEGGPITLAILRLGDFALMLHPQEDHAEEFAGPEGRARHPPAIARRRRRRLLSALPGRGGDAQRLGRAGRPELGLARVRPEGPRRLRLVDLPGQVRRSVDLILPDDLRASAALGPSDRSEVVIR